MRIDGGSQCALIGRAPLVRFTAFYGIIITDIGGVVTPLLPRVWSTRRDDKKRNFAPVTEIWNFHGVGGTATRLICVIWANLVVRTLGLQSLSYPHGKATPV